MSFAAAVLRWLPDAQRIAPDLDPAHVLAIIEQESKGKPGIIGSSSDLGLMQFNPRFLADFNTRHKTRITKANLTGTSKEDTDAQLYVGTVVLRRCLQHVHDADPHAHPWPPARPTDEQILSADLCYSAGAGAYDAARRAAVKGGYKPTFAALELVSRTSQEIPPNLRIPARKFGHARRVLAGVRGYNRASSSSSLPVSRNGKSSLISIIPILFLLWLLFSYFSKRW